MRRIGVAFFYDQRGIVDEYFIVLLRALAPFIKEIIVVCNGMVDGRSLAALNATGVEVRIRKNEGFDVWAYKECLEHIGPARMSTFDEIILFNHTFYGPIFPFAEMFDAMDSAACDFWGITAHKGTGSNDFFASGPLPAHLNSHFIAVRNRMATSPAFSDYWAQLPEVTSYTESIIRHEARFTKHFEDLGYVSRAYVQSDKFASPYPLFEQLDEVLLSRCPIIKRRSLFADPILLDQLAIDSPAALAIIKNDSTYDIDLIWKNLLRTTQLRILHTNTALLRILPDRRRSDAPRNAMRICICAHVYYMDLLPEILGRCAYVEDFDLILTTDTLEKKAKIEHALDRAGVRRGLVALVERNIGADVSALLMTAAPHIRAGNYDVVCRIHTKKSPSDPAARARFFKLYLLDNLLAGPGFVSNLLDLFADNPLVGLAIPPAIHVSYPVMGNGWFTNRPLAEAIAKRIGIDVDFDDDTPVAPYGSMFWFRPAALQKLFDHPWCWEDFDHVGPYSDGDPPHAIERLYAYVAQDAGFLTMAVMSTTQAERNFVRLEYKVQKYASLAPAGDFAYNCDTMSRWKKDGYPGSGAPTHAEATSGTPSRPKVLSTAADRCSRHILEQRPAVRRDRFLRRMVMPMSVHIDGINGLSGTSGSAVRLRQPEEIVVEGWAVPRRYGRFDWRHKAAFGAVVVWLSNETTGVSGLARLVKRPDLARHFAVSDFVHSGFRCTLPVGGLPLGAYVLSIFGIQDNGQYCEALNATSIMFI